MDTVKKFLESHDLEKELLNDRSFVSKSKKLFEEHRLEFSKKQLKEIIEGVQENLEDIKELPENELEAIVGGGVGVGSINEPVQTASKEQQPGTAGIAVKVTGSILGALIGGGLGLMLSTKTTKSNFEYDGKKGSSTAVEYTPFPAVAGAGAGSVVGYKLGKLIVNKYNL